MNRPEPFFFGEENSLLFGCYHPAEQNIRNCAVVLCYPAGHECIQFHRVFRQLAALLAAAGFPVLRFDFYGSGDSSGDTEDARIHQWLIDIRTATGEAQQRSEAAHVCLVGLRLGASLSLLSGLEVDGLVLWDPVVDGRTYLDELTALHREMLSIAHLKPEDHGPTELLGFPLTDQMRVDLESLNLQGLKQKPANHILVIQSHETADQQPLAAHLRDLRASVKYLHLPNPSFWTWMEDFSHVLVPQPILHAVVEWMSEVYQ